MPLFLLAALVGPAVPSGRALAQKDKKDKEGAELATVVYGIFQKSCFQCHGKGGSNEGAFGSVLNHPELVQTKVKPGDPDKSRLWKRLGKAKDMPPDPAEYPTAKGIPVPTADEMALVKKWIEIGAPAWVLETIKARSVITPVDELVAMRDYLRNCDKLDRPYVRFFTMRDLYNQPPDRVRDADLRLYRAALSKLINSLSWKSDIVVPVSVPVGGDKDKEGSVLAVDIRKLDWDTKNLWQEILRYYPYALRYTTLPPNRKLNDLADEVYTLAGTELPMVRADWFIANAGRPPLYHTLLQIPKYAYELEKKLGVDVEYNFTKGKLARAAFTSSGVSNSNRMIERHASLFGAYWKSYDFANSSGQKNLFVFPLGPVFKNNPYDRYAFKHDGGEMIFNLPNGMQGYMLIKAKDDERIDEGPIAIVSDSKKFSGTPEVVNGISCMGCHRDGMIDAPKDMVRTGHVLGSGELSDQIYRLYPAPEDMAKLIGQDRKKFLRAVDDACAPFLQIGADAKKDVQDFPESVTSVARDYVLQEIRLEDAARELLVQPADLAAAIKANPILMRMGLYPLTQPNATIKREVWENTDFTLSPYQQAALVMKLGSPMSFTK
jgi:serine/threonine-protein kinase